jgi:hypothetical protein
MEGEKKAGPRRISDEGLEGKVYQDACVIVPPETVAQDVSHQRAFPLDCIELQSRYPRRG